MVNAVAASGVKAIGKHLQWPPVKVGPHPKYPSQVNPMGNLAIGFVVGVVAGHFYPQIFQLLKGLIDKFKKPNEDKPE